MASFSNDISLWVFWTGVLHSSDWNCCYQECLCALTLPSVWLPRLRHCASHIALSALGTLDWLRSWMTWWAFAASFIFPCASLSFGESLRVHTIFFYFTQAAEISTKSSLPQSVFHSLDVADAAWGSHERTVLHKCGSVSEETRIKVFGQLHSCVLWSCLCSCPVTGEPCGQAQTFPHLPTHPESMFLLT